MPSSLLSKAMKKETKRYVTHITVNHEHFLANLFAMRRLLGFPIDVAKTLSQGSLNNVIELIPYREIKSNLDLDDLKKELTDYGIEIKVLIK